jgi:hypothetical protein
MVRCENRRDSFLRSLSRNGSPMGFSTGVHECGEACGEITRMESAEVMIDVRPGAWRGDGCPGLRTWNHIHTFDADWRIVFTTLDSWDVRSILSCIYRL